MCTRSLPIMGERHWTPSSESHTLTCVLPAAGLRVDDSQLQEMMDLADEDGGGTIDFDEFKALIEVTSSADW